MRLRVVMLARQHCNGRAARMRESIAAALTPLLFHALQGKICGSTEGLAIGIELFDFIVADAQKICSATAGFWLQHIHARGGIVWRAFLQSPRARFGVGIVSL